MTCKPTDGALGCSPCAASDLLWSTRLARTGSVTQLRSALLSLGAMHTFGVEVVFFFQNDDGTNPETRRWGCGRVDLVTKLIKHTRAPPKTMCTVPVPQQGLREPRCGEA